VAISCDKHFSHFFLIISYHVTCTFLFLPFHDDKQKIIKCLYLTNKAFSFWVFFAHQNACDKDDFLSWQDLKSNILLVKNILRCVTKIENLGGVETRGHLLKAYLWHREQVLCHILGVLRRGNRSFFERSNYQMAWSLWT